MPDGVTQHAELFFRMHVHTTLPLHEALVDAICHGPDIPTELALVLEDIGQGYCRMADQVNAELVRRNKLGSEPDSEDSTEARIAEFLEHVVAGLGHVAFIDGQVVDSRSAVQAHPVALDALRAALILAKVAGAAPALNTRAVRREGGSPGGVFGR